MSNYERCAKFNTLIGHDRETASGILMSCQLLLEELAEVFEEIEVNDKLLCNIVDIDSVIGKLSELRGSDVSLKVEIHKLRIGKELSDLEVVTHGMAWHCGLDGSQFTFDQTMNANFNKFCISDDLGETLDFYKSIGVITKTNGDGQYTAVISAVDQVRY